MENSLEVKNLCKKYNGFELKNVNLNLPNFGFCFFPNSNNP